MYPRVENRYRRMIGEVAAPEATICERSWEFRHMGTARREGHPRSKKHVGTTRRTPVHGLGKGEQSGKHNGATNGV